MFASSPAEPGANASDTPQPDEARMVRAITGAAAAIAVIIAVAGPGTYLGLVWRAQKQEVDITARLHAAFVTQAISQARGDWRTEITGLLEAELTPSTLPEQRRIVAADATVVDRTETEAPWPRLQGLAPLLKDNGRVGDVVIVRSMQPLLFTAGGVGVASGLLGLLVYFTLRVLPLRVLRRTLAALADEQARSRRALEQRVDLLFRNAIDGIVIFDDDGIVRSCNPQAARLFGVDAALVPGQLLSRWLAIGAQGLGSGQIETQARRESSDGSASERFPVEMTITEFPVDSNERLRLGMLRDISERQRAERHLAQMAKFDHLTGLPNRSLFRDRLAGAIARADRSARPMALMFLDLDRFKTINDSLGHEAGDHLLQHVAQTLTRTLRKSDVVTRVLEGAAADDRPAEGFTVSRLGGDEFTVIAEDLSDARDAGVIAERLLQALQEPLYIGMQEIVVTVSIGITVYPLDPSPLDDLLRHADTAMYRAKELGRNNHHFYSEALNAESARRLQLEGRLRHALERDEFRLLYQPKLDLHTGMVTGAEALLRWQPQGEAEVMPDQFITTLEETGLIVPVGEWVLREGIRQLQAWSASGLPPLRLAVNLSARQLRRADFAARLAELLRETGLPPGQLELELTESLLMAEDASQALAELGALGVQLAIDDFGTGYSSLSYLKRFDVDSLKIDRSFVRDIPGDKDDCAIASTVIALGHSLGLRVVAEGVETEAQERFLHAQGCDEMQGYRLGRPMAPEAFLDWWRSRLAMALEAV